MFAEAFRVLKPGGRFAISDVVLSRPLPAGLESVTALWTGCISGALTEEQCRAGLIRAGFEAVSIEATRVFDRAALEDLAEGVDAPAGLDVEAALAGLDGVIRSASIRAVRPPAG